MLHSILIVTVLGPKKPEKMRMPAGGGCSFPAVCERGVLRGSFDTHDMSTVGSSSNSIPNISGMQYSPPPPEEQFVANLLLLGFDREASEKRYGVALKSDMFHGCNVKGMEVVFHFLFSKISPEAAKEVRASPSGLLNCPL